MTSEQADAVLELKRLVLALTGELWEMRLCFKSQDPRRTSLCRMVEECKAVLKLAEKAAL